MFTYTASCMCMLLFVFAKVVCDNVYHNACIRVHVRNFIYGDTVRFTKIVIVPCVQDGL